MNNYYVISKEQVQKQCIACNGAGSSKTQFQGHKFVKTCAYCKGNGYTVTFRTTEIPLIDALKELKVL